MAPLGPSGSYDTRTGGGTGWAGWAERISRPAERVAERRASRMGWLHKVWPKSFLLPNDNVNDGSSLALASVGGWGSARTPTQDKIILHGKGGWGARIPCKRSCTFLKKIRTLVAVTMGVLLRFQASLGGHSGCPVAAPGVLLRSQWVSCCGSGRLVAATTGVCWTSRSKVPKPTIGPPGQQSAVPPPSLGPQGP